MLGVDTKSQTRKVTSWLNLIFSSKLFRTCGTILYIIGLILAFFFILRLWPETAAAFSSVFIILVIGMTLFPGIRRNYGAYRQEKISQHVFLLKTGIEIAEITLTAAAAIYLAGVSARYIGQSVGNAVENRIPGFGLSAGLLSGITAAVVVGLGVGYIAKIIWSRIAKIIIGSPLLGNRNSDDAG